MPFTLDKVLFWNRIRQQYNIFAKGCTNFVIHNVKQEMLTINM